MPLPKTKHPLFELVMPSTKRTVYYRQMLVRDEKILLMAKSSEDENDIYRAVKQVVNNCLQNVDVDSLTTFDIEYVFIKLRAASIGNIVDLAFTDMQDEKSYRFAIDLNEVEMKYPENVTDLIVVSDDTNIKLRYPPATLFDDDKALSKGDDAYEWIASRCIEMIYDGDEVYTPEDCTDEELLNYIMDMPVNAYNQVKEFISNMPSLYYEIKYENSVGTKRDFSLSTLTDFFTFR